MKCICSEPQAGEAWAGPGTASYLPHYSEGLEGGGGVWHLWKEVLARGAAGQEPPSRDCRYAGEQQGPVHLGTGRGRGATEVTAVDGHLCEPGTWRTVRSITHDAHGTSGHRMKRDCRAGAANTYLPQGPAAPAWPHVQRRGQHPSHSPVGVPSRDSARSYDSHCLWCLEVTRARRQAQRAVQRYCAWQVRRRTGTRGRVDQSGRSELCSERRGQTW